jgi:hypothetical protein
MDRREFVKSSLAAGAIGASESSGMEPHASVQERHLYELRIYHLRSDIDPARTRAFFGDHFIPAMQRLDVGPVGAFVPETGFRRESLVVLIDYRSAEEMRAVRDRLRSDRDFVDAWRAFETGPGLPYVRYDSRLSIAFEGHPRVEAPAGTADAAPRVFEMRTYESRNAFSLERKIAMFNEAEIEVFRISGITPVFFGEDLVGPRLPSLTYMVAFADIAAREQAWTTFRAHPEWLRIRDDPRWAAEGAVSASDIALLRPTAFSQIR